MSDLKFLFIQQLTLDITVKQKPIYAKDTDDLSTVVHVHTYIIFPGSSCKKPW